MVPVVITGAVSAALHVANSARASAACCGAKDFVKTKSGTASPGTSLASVSASSAKVSSDGIGSEVSI